MRLTRILLPCLLLLCLHGAGQNPREAMWMPEIAAYMQKDSAAPPAKGAILFTGSSSIRMWKGLADYFPGYQIVQRGVGGSHLEDIIYFAEKIVFPYSPRQIVLYEGDNDLKDGFSPERFMDDVKTFVRLVQIRQPGTSIVLLSVKPSPARDHLQQAYMQANRLMAAYAASQPGVTFVDTTPSVIGPDGQYIESHFMSDKLHINEKAYKQWAEMLRPHLIPEMVDRQATAPTRALYRNLKTIGKKGTMFGHQDATAYGIGWKYEPGRSDVHSVCGDYPAVCGWEIGGIELGVASSLDSVRFDVIRRLIGECHARGGVNTISWHARNPLTGGDTWDVKGGGNAVATILPGGANHTLFTGWLDRVAAFLGSLKDTHGAPIPVIFRPFHEHTGSWFWWGRDLCTTGQYTQLWQFTVGYLRDVKGLHNLVYSYSPDRVADQGEYLERYPGDAWVDLLGLDLYQFKASGVGEYRKCMRSSLDVLSAIAAERDKPFAVTETGLECIPTKNWFTGVLAPLIEPYAPAYVLLWRNAYERKNHYYAPYPGHPSCPDFIKYKLSGRVLFNAALPDMYKTE